MQTKTSFALLAVAFAVIAASACAREMTLGIDVAPGYPNQTVWDCLRKQGIEFVVVRCFRSTGVVDEWCTENVQRAWKAGLKSVDMYFFPCVKCGNATGQMTALKEHIDKDKLRFGRIFIDVEMSLLNSLHTYAYTFFHTHILFLSHTSHSEAILAAKL